MSVSENNWRCSAIPIEILSARKGVRFYSGRNRAVGYCEYYRACDAIDIHFMLKLTHYRAL
jgi:hypothetical protein